SGTPDKRLPCECDVPLQRQRCRCLRDGEQEAGCQAPPCVVDRAHACLSAYSPAEQSLHSNTPNQDYTLDCRHERKDMTIHIAMRDSTCLSPATFSNAIPPAPSVASQYLFAPNAPPTPPIGRKPRLIA